MSNSQDESWMADYCDFEGNSSDEENCDFIVGDSKDEHLSKGESLDLERYEEFGHLTCQRKLAIEDIRCRYGDDKWGQAHSRLDGDRSTFTSPCLGPMQLYTRQRRSASFFLAFGGMT